MITLLLGTDTLAKKERISQEAKLRQAEVEIFTESSTLPSLGSLFEQQLFGAPKIVVLDHVWKKLSEFDLETLLKVGDDKSAALFVLEDSLDKRKKVNQDFLKDKRVTVVQLDAPVGTQGASQWIRVYAANNQIAIESSACLSLARALLIDETSVLDVARVQNELLKLSSYANGQPINSNMVGELTENITGVDIFGLLNAIGTRNKKLALKMLETYFSTSTLDEKANAIKLAALLSDQFRSLLITIDAVSRKLPDAQVLTMTGWKTGRLSVMKRLSGNFSAGQLKQSLSKLENLDREMKTGTLPPHVVLDLIIADM